MYDKFKYLLKDDVFFYGILVIFVALLSFGLGRWSMASGGHFGFKSETHSVKVLMPDSVSALIPQNDAPIASDTVKTRIDASGQTASLSAAQYVGSKNGTKYHLLTCPGAKQIKEENKIFFATKEDAQKSGYTPAANCPGI